VYRLKVNDGEISIQHPTMTKKIKQRKIVATRGQILRLKCTKYFSARAPPQTPLGRLQRSPRTPSWKEAYF